MFNPSRLATPDQSCGKTNIQKATKNVLLSTTESLSQGRVLKPHALRFKYHYANIGWYASYDRQTAIWRVPLFLVTFIIMAWREIFQKIN